MSSKNQTTIYLSNELTEALRLRRAIDRRSVTGIIEEACWDWLRDKGDAAGLDARIARLKHAQAS